MHVSTIVSVYIFHLHVRKLENNCKNLSGCKGHIPSSVNSRYFKLLRAPEVTLTPLYFFSKVRFPICRKQYPPETLNKQKKNGI